MFDVRVIVLGLLIVAGLLAPMPDAERSSFDPRAVASSNSTDPSASRTHAERATILELVRAHRRADDQARLASLTEAVHQQSVEAGVDPLMVAAIVARESSFRTRVVSSAGAVGLMQLRPWVAEDVALRSELTWNGTDTLRRPDANVRLGILYYQQLIREFDGNERLALTAYNRGPSRLRRELRAGSPGTSRYAEDVLDLYRQLDARRSVLLAAQS